MLIYLRTSKEDDLTKILKLIAPGTPIREGLDNILKAKTGGLIVFGDSKEVLDLVDGGFYINEDYMQMLSLYHHQKLILKKLVQGIEQQNVQQSKLKSLL